MGQSFRGTRRKTRSMKGRRLTSLEKRARAADCKHLRFRYRKRGLEAVCLNCGSVQKLATNEYGEVIALGGWRLELDEEEASSTAPAPPHQSPPLKE